MSKKRSSKKAAAPAERPQQELPKLTRADLRKWDNQSRDLILSAQDRGARVRISNRGHAIVYGPNGGSASVPNKSSSGNRSSANARAAVERLFRS